MGGGGGGGSSTVVLSSPSFCSHSKQASFLATGQLKLKVLSPLCTGLLLPTADYVQACLPACLPKSCPKQIDLCQASLLLPKVFAHSSRLCQVYLPPSLAQSTFLCQAVPAPSVLPEEDYVRRLAQCPPPQP